MVNNPWFNFFLSELRAENYPNVAQALMAGLRCGYLTGELDDIVFNLMVGSSYEPLVNLIEKSSAAGEIIYCWLYMRTPLFEGSAVTRPDCLIKTHELSLKVEDDWTNLPHLEAGALFDFVHKFSWTELCNFQELVSSLLATKEDAMTKWFELIQEGHIMAGGGDNYNPKEYWCRRIFAHIFLDHMNPYIKQGKENYKHLPREVYKRLDTYRLKDLYYKPWERANYQILRSQKTPMEAYSYLKNAYSHLVQTPKNWIIY